MQAVILVGGEGTRLRPLTSLRPKPVITLVDRPFLRFMLEWLRGHGVTDVVLCSGFLPTAVEEALGDGSSLGLSITYLAEPDRRGTAGALKFAEEHLQDRFLMLNGDVLTDVDVTAQVAFHERVGATATLGLVPVEDPSAYGLVLKDADGAVTGFLEKPGPEQLEGVTDFDVSAGIYVLERSVLDLIPPDREVSIEREVWPRLVGEGLFALTAQDRYWMDIGTPERYLQGTADILSRAVHTEVADLLDGAGLAIGEGAVVDGELAGPALVGAGARIEAGARVVGPAVLGPGATVRAGAVVEGAVVLDGAEVGERCLVADSVLAPGCRLGAGCVVRGRAMVGQDVQVGEGNVLANGIKVFPGAELGPGAVKF
jgi:mannose-1-phosphate guanylyltransferase